MGNGTWPGNAQSVRPDIRLKKSSIATIFGTTTMDIIKARCPECGNDLEFPGDFANVTCAYCGTAYLVREYKGTINLSKIEVRAGDPDQPARQELSDLDEHIAELNSEIEMLKSKEQGAPLQLGCGVFGIFFLAVLVITFFMTLGINYFGKWPFYVSLAVIVGLGLMRMRRRLPAPAEIEKLRQARDSLENDLASLELERRERIQDLGSRI
jgi:hypothetical protein